MARDCRRGVWCAGLATTLLTGILALAAVPEARAQSCTGEECGVPSCSTWEGPLRVRPDMPRRLSVYCRNALDATLTVPPAHGEITDVSVDWYGLRFTMHADEDAPREDSAVFVVEGYEEPLELELHFAVIPTSENSPPMCDGDEIEQRSSGSEQVDVFMHPYCRDPDGDEFVMEGGGPGTHPDSPKAIAAGEGEANWPYRTATTSGSETAPIWATDVLGARSADAYLEVTVGPGVDRLPECRPNPAYYGAVFPIHARPGAVRRFGIICEDADADPFAPELSSPPERGVLALFDVGDGQDGWWGRERWIDATYVPAGAGLDRDEFGVTARGGPHGDGPEARMAIVPRPLPDNGGGGCGWSGVSTNANVPAAVKAWCTDDDGDELTAQVIDGPLHGVAGPPAVTPAKYGQSEITVPYVPAPGYEGYDCVKVRIADGHGLEFELTIDIWVHPASVELPELPVDPPLPEVLPPLPPLPGPGAAVGGRPVGDRGAPIPPRPPGDAAAQAAAVQEVLAAPDVERVPAKGAEVWAASKISRRDLLRHRRAPGLLVVCPEGCSIRAGSFVETPGGRRPRAARHRAALAVSAGQPRLVWIAPSSAELKRLRRARRARARFALAIRAPGERSRPLRYAIPIGA